MDIVQIVIVLPTVCESTVVNALMTSIGATSSRQIRRAFVIAVRNAAVIKRLELLSLSLSLSLSSSLRQT